MLETITELELASELESEASQNSLTLKLDGHRPECPLQFWQNGQLIWEIANDEIPTLLEAIRKFEL